MTTTTHTYDFSHHGVESIQHENSCFHCGQSNIIICDKPALLSWQNRQTLIQDSFPDLHADERELIMTGIHPACWSKMFS